MWNTRRCNTVDLNVHLLYQCYHRNRLGRSLEWDCLPNKTRTLIYKKNKFEGGAYQRGGAYWVQYSIFDSLKGYPVVSYRVVSYPNLVHSYPVWVGLYQKCFTCECMNRSPLYDLFCVRQVSGLKWVRFKENSVVCNCDLRKINI